MCLLLVLNNTPIRINVLPVKGFTRTVKLANNYPKLLKIIEFCKLKRKGLNMNPFL